MGRLRSGRRESPELERVRRGRPDHAGDWLTSAAGQQTWERTLAAVRADSGGGLDLQPSRRRRKLHWPVVVPALLIATAATAGATLLSARDPRVPDVVLCYREPKVDSDAAAPPGLRQSDPLGACSRAWTELWPDAGPAPQLTLCVTLSGGQIAVPATAGASTGESCARADARPSTLRTGR